MLTLKEKIGRIAIGLVFTSFMTVGAAIPVNAAEIQPHADCSLRVMVKDEVKQGSYLFKNIGYQKYPAAKIQYKSDEYKTDGQKFSKFGPKAKFGFKQAKFYKGGFKHINCPVDEEIPADDETPADEESPVDQDSIRIKLYTKLLNSYNKLLVLYEQLLNSFGSIFAS